MHTDQNRFLDTSQGHNIRPTNFEARIFMTLDCKIGLNFSISHRNMRINMHINCEDIAYHNFYNGF